MEELNEKLALHKEWVEDHTKGLKLDLRYADLRYANLMGTNLSGANLRYADLSGADLRYADLSGANLMGTNLSGANLRYADLSNADLSGADLRYAYLRYADLSNANLSNANLSGANLSNANLSGVDLSGVDLRYCTGNNIEVKSLQIGTYLITYTKDILNIGCQSHAHSKWKSFYDDDILSMDGEKALDWWSLNKHIIFELIDRENK